MCLPQQYDTLPACRGIGEHPARNDESAPKDFPHIIFPIPIVIGVS
jgi:hypothetical protein